MLVHVHQHLVGPSPSQLTRGTGLGLMQPFLGLVQPLLGLMQPLLGLMQPVERSMRLLAEVAAVLNIEPHVQVHFEQLGQAARDPLDSG